MNRKARSKSPSSPRNDARQVLDSVRRIVQVLRVASRAAEKGVGLSGPQLFVLQHLADNEAISLNELAERTLTHQSSVSVVVQRLVERGLVSRTRSDVDSRRLELSLTRSGRALLRKSPRAAQDQIIDAVERLSSNERATLARSLHALTDAMGVADEPAPMLFEDQDRARKSPRNART